MSPQRNSQDVRSESPDSFLRFCFCAFIAYGSSANRRKIVQNSTKILPRPTPNRRKIDLEPFWAPKAVSGTRPDGTVFGRPHAAPKPILGRPQRAKSGQELSKTVPGQDRRRYRLFRRGGQACLEHASNPAEHDHGTQFCCFCVGAQSSDVRFILVFTMFGWSREKSTQPVHKRQQSWKIDVLWLQNQPKSGLATRR